MPLPGFFQSLRAMLVRPVQYSEDKFHPVHLFLFDARRMGTPCDQATPGKGPRAVLRGLPPIAPSVCNRLEQLSLSTAEMPTLAVDVGNQTQVSIIGTDADMYNARFCAQAGGADEDDARRTLEKITLTRAGQLLEVRTPQYSLERPLNAWLHVEAARHRAVTVNGSYSYTEIFGIDAPVRVSTTHARIKLLEVTGEVQATACVGVIDFAGDRGRVQLNADGEIGTINLKLTATRFEGTLDTKAEVAIRILLPPAYESPFEAIVDRPDLFVCRADIAPYVRRRDRDGLVVFAYGLGDPVLRFVSRGVLVIDSTDRLQAPLIQ
jgi:hypothetical protein